MLRVRVGRIYVRLDFSFFAVVALTLAADASRCGIMSFLACISHEMGHLLVMLFQRNKPGCITFYGGGIKISRCSCLPSCSVLLAGSLTNFLIAFSFLLFSDRTNIFPLLFICINIIVGTYNLLPLKSLDGGQLAERVLLRKASFKTAQRLLFIAQLCSFVLIFTLAYVAIGNGIFNISLFLVLFYTFILDFFVRL